MLRHGDLRRTAGLLSVHVAGHETDGKYVAHQHRLLLMIAGGPTTLDAPSAADASIR